MITGGYSYGIGLYNLNSTEILDTEDGSVTMASPMNSKRRAHGMGVVTVNGEDRLAVFGGQDGRKRHNSAELYNAKTGIWEKSDIQLNEQKCEFGFVTVKLSNIIPELQCSSI